MLKHPVQLLFGLLVVGAFGTAQYRGWSLLRTNEVRNVPRSVRDNPGSYRPTYSGASGRYMRGK
jgi:hypothetical protein